jgi:hypothetical protein
LPSQLHRSPSFHQPANLKPAIYILLPTKCGIIPQQRLVFNDGLNRYFPPSGLMVMGLKPSMMMRVSRNRPFFKPPSETRIFSRRRSVSTLLLKWFNGGECLGYRGGVFAEVTAFDGIYDTEDEARSLS